MALTIDYIDITPVYSEVLRYHAKKCKEFLVKPVKDGELYQTLCHKCGEILFKWKGKG